MNLVSKERLHLLQKVEEMLKEMIRKDMVECSETTERCMKHIIKLLRILVYRIEVSRVESLRDKGKITPKEAVHRKALLRKRYR